MSKEEMITKIKIALIKADPVEFDGDDGQGRTTFLAEKIATYLLESEE